MREEVRIDARLSPKAEELREGLSKRVIGQADAVDAVTRVYEIFLAGFCDPRRPIASLLFLGPTGTGKTRLVEALAECLFGKAEAALRIDCSEFQHSHEVAKLIGAPPGYLGHRETEALLSQARLERHWSEGLPKLSLLLFDEIEKADHALFDLLLGAMEHASIHLGNGTDAILSRAIIFMTANLGGREIIELAQGAGMGFAPPLKGKKRDVKIGTVAERAARKKFSPEFFNRIQQIVVFRTLSTEQLEQILAIELARVQDRLLSSGKKFVLQVTFEAREFLIKHGTDERYGARPMRRAIEKHLVFPLSSLVAADQASTGDVISVGADHSGIVFSRAKMAAA